MAAVWLPACYPGPVAVPRLANGARWLRGPAFQVLHLLVGGVGHGGDERGDDFEVLVAPR